MEDDVDVPEQGLQHAGNSQVELVKVLTQVDHGGTVVVAEVLEPAAPQVVHDGHLGFEPAKAAHEVRADHAGASGHEDARVPEGFAARHRLIMDAGGTATRLETGLVVRGGGRLRRARRR